MTSLNVIYVFHLHHRLVKLLWVPISIMLFRNYLSIRQSVRNIDCRPTQPSFTVFVLSWALQLVAKNDSCEPITHYPIFKFLMNLQGCSILSNGHHNPVWISANAKLGSNVSKIYTRLCVDYRIRLRLYWQYFRSQADFLKRKVFDLKLKPSKWLCFTDFLSCQLLRSA